METLTSSFPSSTRAQLDNIIFYPGPASEKRCESASTGSNEWPDVDEILAQVPCEVWRAITEECDLTGDVMGGDVLGPIDTSSAAQRTTSPAVYLEQINPPPCTPLYLSQDQALEGGAAAEPQEAPTVSSSLAQNEATRTSGHFLCQDADSLANDYLLEDHAGLDPWGYYGDNESVSAQITGDLLPLSQAQKTDREGLPLDTLGLLPRSPNRSVECSDESSADEWRLVQPQSQQPAGGQNRDTARLSEIRSSVAERTNDSWRILDADCNTSLHKAPQASAERADSTGSANAADAEDNNSDGPLIPSRRRQRRSLARSSNIAARVSPLCTQQSRSHSTEVEPARVVSRRKRLHRRKGTRCDPLNPDPDDSISLSMSSEARSEWTTVQCFVQRKMVGSQELITIELPAFSLRAPSDLDAAPSLSDDVQKMTPVSVAAHTSKRRARFSEEEEDLLVDLKEQRDPKLSWKEISRRFPNRTIGSLQVHYSTQLKGRRISKPDVLRR